MSHSIDIGSSIQKHRHHGGMAGFRCQVERCPTSESRGGAPWEVSEGSSGGGADLWGCWQLWLEAKSPVGIMNKRFWWISCRRFCKIACFKLSLQLWSMVKMVDCAWWRSNTSVKEVFEGFLWSLWCWPRCITGSACTDCCFTRLPSMSNILMATQSTVYNLGMCSDALHAPVMFYNFAKYVNSKHCSQSGMCSDSTSFHSNNNDVNCSQQC